LADPRFQFLQDLAAELSQGKISFPTFADATLKVRMALNDPRMDVDRIGRFYLLSRASRYPALDVRSADFATLQDEWHAAVGHAILSSLNVPEEIAEAVNQHEEPLAKSEPRDLASVLSIANRVSHGPNPLNNLTAEELPVTIDAPKVMAVLAENTDALRSLAGSLRG
jgi:hypothetical protein